jgi:Protein of unknown function (DUF2934)
MIAKSRSRQPRAAKTAQSTDIEDRIRHRAYQLYEQRGTVDGFALDDWLQAEAEVLRAQKQRKVKSAKAVK